VRPTVVLCHGSSQSKDWGFFPEIAERLARAGCAVASFTFVTSKADSVQQLGLVLDALGRDAYGLLGYGSGGAVALARSLDDKRVRAVVTWGTSSQDSLKSAGTVPVPWLIVHDATDESVPALEQALRASIDWFMRHLP